jgi:hypothetical protein
MKLTRRALLRTGGASLLILGAGSGWLATRRSRSAREPWRRAGESLGDPRLDALAFAILAPSAHNTQPWQVVLDAEDGLRLYARRDRLLPETDPPSRQSTISFGCFLELLRQAAAERGYRAEMAYFPEGEPQPALDDRPVAAITLVPDGGVERDPLFAVLRSRHTQRAAFDTGREVPEAVLSRVVAAAGDGTKVAFSTESSRREVLRRLSAEAWISEWENAATRQETIRVTRIGKAEVSADPWGITLDGALLDTLGALGLLSRAQMNVPGTASYDETLKSYLAACNTAMAHLWMSTAGNSRRDQLRAGASWVRLHQAAAREGLAFHPLSQALQEFPAMAPHYHRVHELLAPTGHTLQMLARLGYAGAAGPSPREPLTSKLVRL